jgi:protein involved in polysaccharide export with SLBB domain
MNFKKILFLLVVFLGAGSASMAQTVINAGQLVKITLRGVPPEESVRVSGDYPVSSSGTINLPLISPLQAAGLSPTALATRIENAYKSAEIFNEPTVSVIASTGEAIATQVVHVGGHVRRTGRVEYVPGLTIYQAIQIAGGADEFGAMNRVLLNRNGKVQAIDVTKAQFKNFVLLQNDTIEVPEKNIFGK